MYKPNVEQLKAAMRCKGYPVQTGTYELNIIGIRNDSASPNSFDDTICVLFRDEYGDDVLLAFPCTTDPGLFWLKHPMNVEGCIIMKEGHYDNVYQLGYHRGYKALVQIGKIHYVRDNNKDDVLDFNKGKDFYGVFATNIHHAALPESSVLVDKWSAGCQVINKGWQEFIDICQKAAMITEKPTFSYTLMNIMDVK